MPLPQTADFTQPGSQPSSGTSLPSSHSSAPSTSPLPHTGLIMPVESVAVADSVASVVATVGSVSVASPSVADMLPPSVGSPVVGVVSLVGGVVLVGSLVSPVESPVEALSEPPLVVGVLSSPPHATRAAAPSPRQRSREMF